MAKMQLNEAERIYQNQLNQETQLGRLISEYTVLDKANLHRLHARGGPLEKRNKVIQVFLKEHANILTDLKRAVAPGRIKEDEKNIDKVCDMVHEKAFYDDKVSTFRKYLQELDSQCKLVEKDVLLLRKDQVSDKQMEERVWNAIKTVETLENKLEVQMRKFGAICARNKELRREIDHLLHERRVFLKLWNGLIDKLAEGKRIMLDLIEQATIAYNQRDELCTKLQILRRQAHTELNSNIQDMDHYKRKVDRNVKLRDFLDTKGQKRVMKSIHEKLEKKRQLMIINVNEKLENYKSILRKIERFTKESSLVKVTKKFVQDEETNMSNFIHVIDMIRESEELSDQLALLHVKIDEEHELFEKRNEQQKTRLEELDLELEKAKAETEVSRNRLKEKDEVLQTFYSGITDLFRICKCEKDPLANLLGENNSVTFYNVHLYLEIIELKSHEILIGASHKDTQRKPGDKRRFVSDVPEVPQIYTIDKIVKRTPCSLCVEHEMVSIVIDTLQHAWSKSEAKKKLKQRLGLPDSGNRLHTISNCHLPKSRQIMQKRYE